MKARGEKLRKENAVLKTTFKQQALAIVNECTAASRIGQTAVAKKARRCPKSARSMGKLTKV